MTQEPYKRQQGDFELRIRSDGSIVFVAPDETLLEIAQAIESDADAPQSVESDNGEKPGQTGQ
jgi:hypothetical protein